MANYANTQDIKIDVLNKCGELSDGTSEYDSRVLTYINRAYQAMLSGGADLGLDVGEPWPWAQNKYNSVLTLLPPITSTAFDATNGNTTVTFETPPSAVLGSLIDWYIKLDDFAECYRVATHIAGASTCVIDAPFNNTTGAGYSGQLFKIDYDLAAQILRLVAPFISYRNTTVVYNDAGQINFEDSSQFARDFPINQLESGTPNMATQIYKDNTVMKPRIRVNRIPDQQLRVEYNFIPVPSALIDDPTSIPIVPLDHRITLVYYATYYMMLDKNDSRFAEYRELTRAGMMALKRAGQQEKILSNPDYGKMIARPDLVPKRRRLWWQYYV